MSVDRPVIGKTRNATGVPMDVAWSDVGSWQALHELAATDDSGDALHRDVLPLRTTNSLVHSTGRLVAMLGVEGLIVAETADAVLVADRHEAERVGEVATRIAQCGRPEHRDPSWGLWSLGTLRDRRDGAGLPGQAHHREPRGQAVAADASRALRITGRHTWHGRGDLRRNARTLAENESTRIPQGRLASAVQSGRGAARNDRDPGGREPERRRHHPTRRRLRPGHLPRRPRRP